MAGLFRVNFYPRDWIVGTAGLTLELRGLYIELIARLYVRGEPLTWEADQRELARGIGIDIRTLRRLVGELIRRGKLTLADGRLSNQRFEEEIAKAAAHSDRSRSGGNANARKRPIKQRSLEEIDPNFGRTSAELRPEVPPEVETGFLENQRVNGKRVKSQESRVKEETPSPASTPSHCLKNGSLASTSAREKDDDAADVIPPGDFHAVGDRVLAIIENGRGGHPTLRLNFSRVQIWLRNGADPELDIYPTIERVMAKRNWDPPGSLNYFDRAIADAVAARTKPMPNGAANGRATGRYDRNDPDYIAERAEKSQGARRIALTRAVAERVGQGRDAGDPDGAASSGDRGRAVASGRS